MSWVHWVVKRLLFISINIYKLLSFFRDIKSPKRQKPSICNSIHNKQISVCRMHWNQFCHNNPDDFMMHFNHVPIHSWLRVATQLTEPHIRCQQINKTLLNQTDCVLSAMWEGPFEITGLYYLTQVMLLLLFVISKQSF